MNGSPEGDGGVFSTEASTLTLTNPAQAVLTFDWSTDGENLTFLLTDCVDRGAPCEDADVIRFLFERPWTFVSPDPSYE